MKIPGSRFPGIKEVLAGDIRSFLKCPWPLRHRFCEIERILGHIADFWAHFSRVAEI